MEIILNEYQRIEKYTNRRIKQLKGEIPDIEPMDPDIERYTRRRLRELRREREMRESKFFVDNMLRRGYALATMEVYGGE
jgi:hypothetical protein